MAKCLNYMKRLPSIYKKDINYYENLIGVCERCKKIKITNSNGYK